MFLSFISIVGLTGLVKKDNWYCNLGKIVFNYLTRCSFNKN
jgi:hypothetical protein